MQKTQNIVEENDQIEEEGQFYNEIDKLETSGINVADIAKLKLAGFCTIKSLFMAPKKELLNIKGITDAKLEKILDGAQKLETLGFQKGTDVLIRRRNLIRLTTGSNELNKLLGGGVESQAITEMFGEFRTGKTQLCLTLCVTAQIERSQGGGNDDFYVLKTLFPWYSRPERILKIAERYGLDGDAVLDNIAVARAYTVEHLWMLLIQIASKMMEDQYALLIVDSIMALFRVDFSGRGELSERQQVLGKVLSKLIKLAEQFNIAVVITNQVMADPSGAMGAFMGDTKKPVGGNILAHASTTRLYLRKGKGEQRVCKIYDSPCLPESEATFQISEMGIIDPSD